MNQPMVSPDEGMRSLFAGLGPPAPAAGTSGPAAGLELDLGARLVICLEGMTAALGRLGAREGFTWEECHPVQIAPNIAVVQQGGATYLIDDPDRWGPRKGWAWWITRLTIAMPSGTATVFRDAPTSGNELLFSVTAGTWEPSRGEVLLPGQRLVVQASSVAVVNGEAIEIWLPRLADFLMAASR